MFPQNSRIIRLDATTVIKPFDCDDADLNEFLLQDAKASMAELLTVTYILENDAETIAFWSLLNDKIVKKEHSKLRHYQVNLLFSNDSVTIVHGTK